jgi:hypothetical protein
MQKTAAPDFCTPEPRLSLLSEQGFKELKDRQDFCPDSG